MAHKIPKSTPKLQLKAGDLILTHQTNPNKTHYWLATGESQNLCFWAWHLKVQEFNQIYIRDESKEVSKTHAAKIVRIYRGNEDILSKCPNFVPNKWYLNECDP